MELIKIIQDKQIKDGWHFRVVIGGPIDPTHHYVTVNENHWRALTKEEINPEELVEISIKFLLEREAKESILVTFNLHDISRYFPEYETNIRDQSAKRPRN